MRSQCVAWQSHHAGLAPSTPGPRSPRPQPTRRLLLCAAAAASAAAASAGALCVVLLHCIADAGASACLPGVHRRAAHHAFKAVQRSLQRVPPHLPGPQQRVLGIEPAAQRRLQHLASGAAGGRPAREGGREVARALWWRIEQTSRLTGHSMSGCPSADAKEPRDSTMPGRLPDGAHAQLGQRLLLIRIHCRAGQRRVRLQQAQLQQRCSAGKHASRAALATRRLLRERATGRRGRPLPLMPQGRPDTCILCISRPGILEGLGMGGSVAHGSRTWAQEL